MKQLIPIFLLLLLFLASCSEETSEGPTVTDTGTVIDLAGISGCRIVIEMDNGTKIQPTYYPDEFTFAEGQRVLVDYTKLNNLNNGCSEGTPCEISYIEELGCASYAETAIENYDSLATDPVHMHEAYIDNGCLYFKLSYSGGCSEHTIDLVRVSTDTSGDDTTAYFQVVHDANNDLCEGWITREFRYDISPLKDDGISELVLTANLFNNKIYSETILVE